MLDKTIVNTLDAPSPIGPYAQAVKTGNLLFISGQIAIDPHSGNIVATNAEEEAHQVMKNLAAILLEAGQDFSSVVKTTIFLSDMSLFGVVNEVYAQYITVNHPARETDAVSGLPKGVNVEISMIALG